MGLWGKKKLAQGFFIQQAISNEMFMHLNFHATHWGQGSDIFGAKKFHHFFAINILEEEDIVINSLFS